MVAANARILRKTCISLVTVGLFWAACAKDSRPKPSPWDDVYRPPSIEAHRGAASGWKAPALLAHVPADTPYVFAGFAPTPAGFWGAVCDRICPALAAVLGVTPDQLNGRDGRVIAAVFHEFASSLNRDGLTRLGFGAEPRWVLYGLGMTPVLRVEIADAAAVEGTIERIAAAARLPLERRAIGGQSYFYGLIYALNAVAVGVVDRQLVLVWGEPDALAMSVERLFGGTRPAQTMADGAALKKVAADYGFAGYGVGYVDVARVLELDSADDSDACKQTRGQIASVLPRVVFGYDEIRAKRLVATAIFETTVIDRLRPLQTAVPGFTSRIPQGSLVVAGIAIDRSGFGPLGKALLPWGAMYRIACGSLPFELPGIGGDASQAADLLPAELVNEVRGGAVVITDGNTSPAMPQSLEGYATLGVGAGDRFMTAVASLLARGGVDGAKADGAYHKVDLGNLATFVKTPARVSGRADGFVFTAGERARSTIDEAIADKVERKRPFALFGYDVGKANRPLHRLAPMPSRVDGGWLPPASMKKLHTAAQELLALMVVSAYLGERGVELVARFDLN